MGARPFGSGVSAVECAIKQLGYVQIDTISVVERAHHHVFWSRISSYHADHLAKLVSQKKIFEYWFHAAAFLPIEDFRFALPRMQSIKAGEKHWFENIDKKLIRHVQRRIENEGPLLARDFADTRQTNTGWWDWKPAKQALEKLFMQGDLMVIGREGFQKRYDLTERVLPAGIDTSSPGIDEYAQHLVDTTIRAHGFSSLKSFSYLRKGKDLRAAIKQCVQAYVDHGTLIEVQTPAGDLFYCDVDLFNQRLRSGKNVRLLSPFDNLVIQRERCRQVFDYDYQIECYVPAAKRQFGYFCLPILYGENLVGRVDCKADRKTKTLHVKYLQHGEDSDEFVQGLVRSLLEFMKFNACDAVVVEHALNTKLKKRLQALLQAD